MPCNYVKEPLVGARQMGKITKQRHAKAFKKDKNNLTERTMTPAGEGPVQGCQGERIAVVL